MRELGDRRPGMMTLIALAITVAFVYSTAVVAGVEGEVLYWELATLIDIMLVAHWIYGLDVDPHEAIAMSLLVVGTTSVAGLASHARRGNVDWRIGALFGGAGMVGAYLGGLTAGHVPAAVLLGLFAVVMGATALAMLRGRRDVAIDERPHSGPLWRVLVDGLVVGAVTGLVGAGGGFLVVPALALLGGLSMHRAVGTSLLVIAMKSFAGFAGHASHVQVDPGLTAVVSAAAIVGTFGGVALAHRMSADHLRRGFAGFVLAMAVFLFTRQL